MKRILFIILFIAESLCFYAIGNNELFVQFIKQKDYSSCLQSADNAASCLRFLGNNQISWDEYVSLMSYADEINHPYRDSLIINGVNRFQAFYFKLATGIEPVTSSLPMRCATDCAMPADFNIQVSQSLFLPLL